MEHELSKQTFVYTVKKLKPSSWYKFKVSCTNSSGSSDYMETVRYVQTRPSLPYYSKRKLPWATDVTESTILLNWNKFDSLGEPVISYEVQYRLFTPANIDISDEKDKEQWIIYPYLVERCEAKIENLLPGHRYIFKVKASNALGFGDFCNIDMDNVIQTKSSVPSHIETINVINKTHRYITVGWDMPDANGEVVNGFDIQYQSKKGSATGWTTAEIRVSNNGDSSILPVPQFTLLNDVNSGDSFRFRIRSHNLIGWSTYGPVSDWIHVPYEDIHGGEEEEEEEKADDDDGGDGDIPETTITNEVVNGKEDGSGGRRG